MSETAYILSVKRMKVKELFCKRKIILQTAVATVGVYLALRYADECYAGIEKGVDFCLEVLIPSLFFFMIVSAYITQSGVAEALCRPLGGLSRALFKLPAQSLAVILLSMVGGYPVGASCAAILKKENQLSASEAAKTAYIAVAAGPGFLINFIGSTLLGNSRAGYILLGAQVIAVVLTGVIVGHTVESEPLPPAGMRKKKHGNLLVSAVQSASRAAFGMCAMVVLFSALIEVTDVLIDNKAVCDIASAIIEVTNGCNRTCGTVPLYVTAFFVGFGGLSVHFQIYAALGDIPVKKGLFFLFRIIEGIIAMTATYIYLMVTPAPVTVFSSYTASPSVAHSAALAGSAALVLSSVIFVGSIGKRSVLLREPAQHTRR